MKFVTRSGLNLSAVKKESGKIELDFPENPPQEVTDSSKVEAMQQVLKAGLGIESSDILWLGYSAEDIFVELNKKSFLGIESVNIDALSSFGDDVYKRGVIASTIGAAGRTQAADFSSRFFAPKVGINEDPACGSAHCVLAPYYTNKFRAQGSQLVGYQNSPNRGGELVCLVQEGRVKLQGDTVTVSEGTLGI